MSSNKMNATEYHGLPSLPSYTLVPRPPILAGLPDTLLPLLLPIFAYWAVSFFFYILDTYDLCAQYRLHAPAEVLKRNRVTKYEVVRDVVLQQIIQTVTGLAITAFEPSETIGKEKHDIAVWALRLRMLQCSLPAALRMLGLDTVKLSQKLWAASPVISDLLAGGRYSASRFTSWEIYMAKVIYWALIPTVQFTMAIIIVDTWEYFLHRAMHSNKFLYTKLHSRHHRLYVPYAFGALYNHPVEGFVLETMGAALAYLTTRMSVRQGMWFFTCTTIKTVDDHCGYSFPWDPLQRITSNNAAYHDVHHQSWGIKANFSQPFFTFWDRFFGTMWAGGDVSARHEQDQIAARKKN